MNTEATQNHYFYEPGNFWVIDKAINGRTQHTNSTLEEIRESKNNPEIIIISEDDLTITLDKLAHENYIDKPAIYIDEERYDDMLNCLPPCSWHTYLGVSFFHISERLTHDIVAWFAKSGDVYVEFNHLSTASDEEIYQKFIDLVETKKGEVSC